MPDTDPRYVGEFTLVETLPESVVTAFGVLTHLGSPWLLVGGLTVLYVIAEETPLDRRTVGFVIAVAVGGAALTLSLKTALLLPRPPGAVESGFGFPSGHTIGATVVWGTLASVAAISTAFRRVGLAALIVVVVGISRVVIEVHYLADVVAGLLVGTLFLAGVLYLGPGIGDTPTEEDVSRAFLVAVAVGVTGLAATVTPRTWLVLGAAVGGWIGWRYARPDRVRLTSFGKGTGLVILVPLLLGVRVLDAVEPGGAVAAAIAAGLMAALMVLPREVAKVAGRPERVQKRAP